MSLKINQSIIQEILSEKGFFDELEEYLNGVIDSELEKSESEMDTELIDECLRILACVEEGDFSFIDEAFENEKIIKFETKEQKTTKRTVIRLRRIIAVAAILMIAGTITMQAFPAVADQVKSYFMEVFEDLFGTAEESYVGDTDTVELEVEPLMLPTIDDVSEANLEGVTIYAVAADGSSKEVSLSDCNVGETKIRTDEDGERYASVLVSYDGASVELKYYFNG